MMLLLIVVAHILCIYGVSTLSVEENKKQISNIFEGFGYSPVCVASALASCERVSKADCYIHRGDLLPELEAHLLEMTRHKATTADNLFTISNFSASLEKLTNEIQDVKNSVTSCVNYSPNQKISKDLDYNLQEFQNAVKKMSNCSSLNDISKSHLDYVIGILSSLQDAKLPQNCAEIRALGYLNSAVRTIYPFGYSGRPVQAYCDQSNDGGGWTVIQNRDALPIRENFYRTWNEYANGFGDVSGEFWLGLDNIHSLVRSTKMEIRIDLEDYEGERRWAKYRTFYLSDVSTNYTLSVGPYSGDAGDCLTYHNLRMFSTYDQDNDISSDNCAKLRRGAWWYNDCTASNLNGFQHVGNHSTYEDGINWDQFRGSYYSLKRANMKIRPAVL